MADPRIMEAITVAEQQIEPLLKRRHPTTQGAILAQLLAKWVVGHKGGEQSDELMLLGHVDGVRSMIKAMRKKQWPPKETSLGGDDTRNLLGRFNDFMGSYAVQNWLFIIAIWVWVFGMISGLMTVTYVGSSWTLGSLISPMFRAHTTGPQMAIGMTAGGLFTYAYALITGVI